MKSILNHYIRTSNMFDTLKLNLRYNDFAKLPNKTHINYHYNMGGD